jgi:hypothetical protein
MGSGESAPYEGKSKPALAPDARRAGEGRSVMKIRSVSASNRKGEFSIVVRSGEEYFFPYSKADPRPGARDAVERAYVDKEFGNEAFTYVLRSGAEGSVHIDHVLEYNEDPQYLADLLTYKLSIEAQKQVERSELSRRQLAKQLNTSVPQLYRLLDPTNTKKSMKQLFTLLHILDYDVDVVLKKQQPNKALQRTVVSVKHFAKRKSKVLATDARR